MMSTSYSALCLHSDKMYSWNDYDPSLKVRMLCMQTAFPQKPVVQQQQAVTWMICQISRRFPSFDVRCFVVFL